MGDIDWEALLEGKEPEPHVSDGFEDLSGLLSVNSEISITASTQSNKESSRAKSVDLSESGSFGNLQSVNDLISYEQSPSPEVPATRSAVSVKSNVTFSETSPEIYNINEDINLLSIGDLVPDEDFEMDTQSDAGVNFSLSDRRPDKFTKFDTNLISVDESPEKITEVDSYTELYSRIDNKKAFSEDERSASAVVTDSKFDDEDIVTEEISEEIDERDAHWRNVKSKVTRNSEIPVFMVGSKKKKPSKDLSSSKYKEKNKGIPRKKKSESRKPSISSTRDEHNSFKYTSERNEGKSFNYTSFTEDVTTVSETSAAETLTQSKTSVTNVKFEAPCCKCKCNNQIADVNIKPIPLFSGMTLDSKTLDELSAMNPDKIALLNMMKAQFNLTKGLIEITSNILKSEIDDCQPTYRHTNLEDTKKLIKKNQPYGDHKHRERISGNGRRKSRHSEKSKSNKTRKKSRHSDSESHAKTNS